LASNSVTDPHSEMPTLGAMRHRLATPRFDGGIFGSPPSPRGCHRLKSRRPTGRRPPSGAGWLRAGPSRTRQWISPSESSLGCHAKACSVVHLVTLGTLNPIAAGPNLSRYSRLGRVWTMSARQGVFMMARPGTYQETTPAWRSWDRLGRGRSTSSKDIARAWTH
jgi:hypothetical protein